MERQRPWHPKCEVTYRSDPDEVVIKGPEVWDWSWDIRNDETWPEVEPPPPWQVELGEPDSGAVLFRDEPDPGPWVELGTLPESSVVKTQNGQMLVVWDYSEDSACTMSLEDEEGIAWGYRDLSTLVRPLRIVDPLDVQKPSEELVERLVRVFWGVYLTAPSKVASYGIRAVLRELAYQEPKPVEPSEGLVERLCGVYLGGSREHGVSGGVHAILRELGYTVVPLTTEPTQSHIKASAQYNCPPRCDRCGECHRGECEPEPEDGFESPPLVADGTVTFGLQPAEPRRVSIERCGDCPSLDAWTCARGIDLSTTRSDEPPPDDCPLRRQPELLEVVE